jgi:hypothetical protein
MRRRLTNATVLFREEQDSLIFHEWHNGTTYLIGSRQRQSASTGCQACVDGVVPTYPRFPSRYDREKKSGVLRAQ